MAMNEINENIALFVLIISSIIIFTTSFIIVGYAEEDGQEYFQIYQENESFIKQYPPFIDQSTYTENVIEEDGTLKVNDSKDYGIYETKINKSSLTKWDFLEYETNINEGSAIISTNDESIEFELKKGKRIIDLSEFENSESIEIILNLEENQEIYMLEVTVKILESREIFADWIYNLLPFFLLILIIFVFYGIVGIKL